MPIKNRTALAWGAGFGMVAVILGALGAHALKASLEPDQLESFKTAVRYQAWHALALVALGAYGKIKFGKAVILCWIAGIFLFSGSIYLLSTRELSGINFGFLGPVTPLGGLSLIAGWFLLLLAALSKSSTN